MEGGTGEFQLLSGVTDEAVRMTCSEGEVIRVCNCVTNTDSLGALSLNADVTSLKELGQLQ